jgi:hypothetical protein
MPGFKVVALVSAFNEEDIVEQVVADLIHQGIVVYFLDDGSTDRTAALVEGHVGRGVMAIERLPAMPTGEFSWRRILARKEQLASELDADWFIHHDADEFREAPWADMSLAQAIERVDREGYSAIDFALLDFRPTHDRFAPGDDVRSSFPWYGPAAEWNRPQVRCWKKCLQGVDLVGSGGHDVAFADRRVYPRRFILRHYPIRGTVHGRRKVFDERVPRFPSGERRLGWHVQYDGLRREDSFISSASDMKQYDPAQVRLDLADEDLRRSEHARDEAIGELDVAHRQLAALGEECRRRSEEVKALSTELARVAREVDALGREREEQQHAIDHLNRELQTVYASRTWRWTRPIRALLARWVRP